MNRLWLGIVSLMLILMNSFVYAAEGFPGRDNEKYIGVPYIEIKDLRARLNTTVVVDTRSKFEFDTLRIKGAINIPVAFDDFEQKIVNLRKRTSNTIVFYCNGRSCMKSYKATQRAMAVNVSNVFAYDAGIFDWAKAYPNKAVLLGKSPINVRDIISKKRFKARMLDADTFSDKATIDRSRTAVIDVRDKYQRAGVGFFPGMEAWASLNDMDKLYKRIRKAQRKNKTIYIYDEVGKQVRWLQYALEKMGVKKYYFMQKGASGYYHMLVTASYNR